MPANRRIALGLGARTDADADKAYTIYPGSSKAKREDADESYTIYGAPPSQAKREDADEAYYIPPNEDIPVAF